MIIRSPKIRAQAAKQVRLLSKVERDSDVVTRRFIRAFNRRSDFAVRRRQPLVLLPTDRHGIAQALTDVMVEAFARRYKLERQRPELQLGFSAVAREIADEFEIDLSDIRNSFEWFTKGRVDASLASVEGRVNQILTHVVQQQLPTATAVREMRRLMTDAGITEKNPRIVETLVRTHSQIAFNAAQYQMDQDDEDNVIWGYTYSTVGDDRVRDSHWAMQGVTRPKDDPIWDEWWPPNGWNCRCQLIAVLGYGKSTPIPDDVEPDDGFDENFGKMLLGT